MNNLISYKSFNLKFLATGLMLSLKRFDTKYLTLIMKIKFFLRTIKKYNFLVPLINFVKKKVIIKIKT